MEGVTVRAMSSSDLPAVLEIADHSFTTPWNLSSFEYEIRNKDAVLNVAEIDSRIVGYICVRSFLGATHIMDIAVIHEYHQKGIGSMLLLEALRGIRRTKPETEHITLEVRQSNIAAIKLYEKYGFREKGRRKNYYKTPNEDGIIMGLNLDMKIQD